VSSGANRRGIAAIVCGMAAFSISDVFTKLVAVAHPLGEVFAVRGVFTAALVGAAMIVMGDWRYWRSALSTGVLARSFLDAASSALYVAALVQLPLTDITAIVLLSPLIVTIIAVVVFREKVDARRWLQCLPALPECCSSSGRPRPPSTRGPSLLSAPRSQIRFGTS